MKGKKKLLLLGWDAADWKSIHPLIDKGWMPNLKRLVENGVAGRLATMDPPLSPMLWTTIATGKRPYKHGIHGFTEVAPDGKSVRPIYGSSRKVRAIWDILSKEGYKCHVVGWWPSHPAEKVNGISISNFYQKAKGKVEGWEMLPGTVFPDEMSKIFADIRIHPNQLTQAHLFPFIPHADKLNQSENKNIKLLHAAKKVLAETATIHNAGTYILEQEEWDFAAIYFDGIDHFGHGFMKYNPPKMDHIHQEEFDMWNNVVTAGYRFHDMMLGRYMELVDEDTTIMLISDHGFHPTHLRPKSIPVQEEHAAPAIEHSPFGVICVSGKEFLKDEFIFGCSIMDITPTILHFYDLPVGRDMDGKVLMHAFSYEKEIKQIDSWEEKEKYSSIENESVMDSSMSKEVLDQLVALGYIEKQDDNPEVAVKRTKETNSYFLARSYMDADMYFDAAPILDKLWKEDKSKMAYALNLAKCYSAIGENSLFKDVMEDMIDRDIEDTPTTHILKGNMFYKEHKFRSALDEFKKAEKLNPSASKLNLQIGNGYYALKQFNEAEASYRKELEIDPENNFAYNGLGMALKSLGRIEEAAESFLSAIGLMFNYPAAHYQYGECLMRLGMHERAAEAFEVAIKQAPGFNTARAQLIKLYKEVLNNPERAEQLTQAVEENIEGEIIVVSGLPRSGTSMMMQMLEKGGIKPFTDGEREKDENNPKGYYEHEAVKSIARNKKFLFDVGDKSIKIIAQLLEELPFRFKYKIIFMTRNLNEIINSQHTMLNRLGKVKEGTHHPELEHSFNKTLRKVKRMADKRTNFDVLYIDYHDILSDPKGEAFKVKQFLSKDLDVAAMAGVVDKSLYRERAI